MRVGSAAFWLREIIAVCGPEKCVAWPYAVSGSGYGTVWYAGRQESAHALACLWVHGPAPSPEHEVAHSCGVPACVNPHHLRWATRIENHADRPLHGTDHVNVGEDHGCAKLTDKLVIEIRAAEGTQRSIAEKFGVTQPLVSMIKNRRIWKHLT